MASLAAINLFGRARATSGRARGTWLAVAGATTGCGIWATHFIAMLAYDPGVGIFLADLADDINAVQRRHAQIEKHHGRVVLSPKIDRLAAICRLSDYDHV